MLPYDHGAGRLEIDCRLQQSPETGLTYDALARHQQVVTHVQWQVEATRRRAQPRARVPVARELFRHMCLAAVSGPPNGSSEKRASSKREASTKCGGGIPRSAK